MRPLRGSLRESAIQDRGSGSLGASILLTGAGKVRLRAEARDSVEEGQRNAPRPLSLPFLQVLFSELLLKSTSDPQVEERQRISDPSAISLPKAPPWRALDLRR